MKIRQNLKHILFACLSSFAMITFLMQVISPDIRRSLNHQVLYTETGWMGKLYPYHLEATGAISIIKIDNESLNKLQAQSNNRFLSIPKKDYITLVERLERAGVKGIAFDIVFQNRDPDEDQFVKTLAKYPNIVIGAGISEGDISTNCQKDVDGTGTTCGLVPRSLYRDIPWGSVTVNEARDGRVYRYDLSDRGWREGVGYTATGIDTLPLALARQTGSLPLEHAYTLEQEYLAPFFGPPGSYQTDSFHMILTHPSDWFLRAKYAGKYVFIGEGGTLIHDAHLSPVTRTMMDGVESHAHALDGILQGRMLTRLDTGVAFLLYAMLLVFSTTLYFLLRKSLAFLAFLALVISGLYLGRFLYAEYGIVIEVLQIFLSLGFITLPTVFIYQYFVTDQEKRYLKNAFGRYVDPQVVRQIAENPRLVTLGGESRELTIFFSDIAGFTSISERLSPTDLFDLMSAYLSKMTHILIEEGGTLDKYIGDAVMGFFGAPLPASDHAVRACRTALRMRSRLPEFNASLLERGLDPIDFRVGIATGEVVVWNIGSDNRFNYTVLGDVVNLASRLEAISKEYGTHIIISEGTARVVESVFHLRELDRIAVKGKQEGVAIYEVLAERSTSLDHPEVYSTYARALDLYRDGAYEEAHALFGTTESIDPPAHALRLRLDDILAGKLVVESGVYHMTHK